LEQRGAWVKAVGEGAGGEPKFFSIFHSFYLGVEKRVEIWRGLVRPSDGDLTLHIGVCKSGLVST
jgi:hypothetical protein